MAIKIPSPQAKQLVFEHFFVEKLRAVPEKFSRHKHLSLSYIKLSKELLMLAHPLITTSLKSLKIIDKIMSLYIKSSKHQNMIFCSCLDFFKFISENSLHQITDYIITHFHSQLETIATSYLTKSNNLAPCPRAQVDALDRFINRGLKLTNAQDMNLEFTHHTGGSLNIDAGGAW